MKLRLTSSGSLPCGLETRPIRCLADNDTYADLRVRVEYVNRRYHVLLCVNLTREHDDSDYGEPIEPCYRLIRKYRNRQDAKTFAIELAAILRGDIV